jgi:hypothetical protein
MFAGHEAKRRLSDKKRRHSRINILPGRNDSDVPSSDRPNVLPEKAARSAIRGPLEEYRTGAAILED